MGKVTENMVRGIKWTAFSAVSGKLISFVLGIILARLLTPADYGVVGLTTIFMTFVSVLADGGLCVALVRKKNLTEEDKSTIFYFNVIVTGIGAVVIFVLSPNIANYFKVPILSDIIKVTSLSMLINSFAGVHWSMCRRNVDFKKPAIIDLMSQIVTGSVAVVLAYMGFGPWALVLQGVSSALLRTVIIWYVFRWRPLSSFSWRSFKELISFGGNLTINNIFSFICNDGIGMLIGKFYSPSELGFYSKGQGLARLPSTFMFDVVGKVLLPVLSKIQDDDRYLKEVAGRIVRNLSAVIFFPMILIISLAQPMLVILYTDKWLPSTIYLQLFCVAFMLYHIEAVNWNLLLVKGRSDWALKSGFIGQVVIFTCVAISLPFGAKSICAAYAAARTIYMFVSLAISKHLFEISIWSQLHNSIPYALLSILACLPAGLLSNVRYPYISLVGGGVLSVLLYLLLMYVCRRNVFWDVVKVTPAGKILKIKATKER